MIKRLVLFTFWFLVLTFSSYAVEIEPMRLEYSLQNGKTYSGSFRLKNTSNFAVEIFISTGDYRYIFSQNTIPPEKNKTALPSCESWFNFEKTKLNLNSGEFCDAKFFIKVPPDASSEQLCAVIFDEKRGLQETVRKENAGNIQINLTPRFSIPVYISIKGAEKIAAEITEMSAVLEPQEGGVKFNITLHNMGNVHIRPFGTLVIFNQKEEVVKNLPIGKSLPIFPDYKERLLVICSKLPAGKYSAIATVEISKDNIVQKKTPFTCTKTGEIDI